MNYSIITPTKNEGKFIGHTLKSVVAQKVLPLEWMIMDDDSSDNTFEIVSNYAKKYPFIKYTKLSSFRKELKNGGGRIAAIINYADSLRTQKADIIAKIDGDISFDANFFLNMISEFKKDELLGVASGHMVENGIPEIITDRKSGRGASLIIRYDCYTQIGKFFESNTRGEDDLAYIAARSFGWKTQTLDYYFNHLKPMGMRNSKLKNHFETGYYKGSLPYWLPYFIGTVTRDAFRKPFVIGSIVQLYAFCLSRFIKPYRPFPEYVTKQLRVEQKKKLIK